MKDRDKQKGYENMSGKKEQNSQGCCSSCCAGGGALNVLTSGKVGAVETVEPGAMSRSTFLKTIAAGVFGLSTVAGTPAFSEASQDSNIRVIPGRGEHNLIVDFGNKEIRFSAKVTRDDSKTTIADWGERAIAWIGTKGGKWDDYFIFTSDVPRPEIDKGIQEIGIKFRRQISRLKKDEHTGLKPSTTVNDYLDGDPMTVTIRFEKAGAIVEAAFEDFIQEKIIVEKKEVIKPYTPHFVYHGTAEMEKYESGCIVCPSDCPGGLITDNTFPLLTMLSLYKVNWDRMPPVGSRVEVALKSIYSSKRLDSFKA
jgi:hypothetical protein